jgi:type IV pilus assembly protein PilA
MKKQTNLGFTLIELMIVVAIIGVLAVLAIFGVSKYLKNAKTAEATNMIGAINQLAVNAYNKESTPAAILAGGNSSTAPAQSLCVSAAPIPGTPPQNLKYQPDPTKDYGQDPGWICLGFTNSQPQYFNYQYTNGGVAGNTPNAGGTLGIVATGWGVGAATDFVTNGGELVEFATGGNVVNGQPVTATAIASFDNATGKPF